MVGPVGHYPNADPVNILLDLEEYINKIAS